MPIDRRRCIFAACILLSAARLAAAEESSRVIQAGSGLSLGTGLTYSTGTYGTPDTTTITSIPFLAKYESGRWTLKLTVPYIEISGNGNVLPGVGRVENTNTRGRGRGSGGTAGTASGPGDVVTSVTYNLAYDAPARSGLDLTGRIKFGTADPDQGLGTGENDYGAQVDVFKGFDRLTLYAGLGYTDFGSSEFIHLDNAFNLTAGGALKVDAARSAGLQYDARDKISAAGAPVSELTAFYVQQLDPRWKMQAYFLKGFRDGSPDWGAGFIVLRAM